MKQIEIEKIIKLYTKDKLSCSQISKKYNCDPETIRLKLKKVGVDTSKKINNKKCIYCNGKTQKHGKLSGRQKYRCDICSKTFTNKTLIDSKKIEDKYKMLEKLYLDEKLSTTEIGKLMNVSSTVIQRILQKLGVTRNVKEGVYNYKYKDFDGDVIKYIDTLNKFNKYKRLVMNETNKQPIHLLLYYNLRGLNGTDGAYQLDHKYSIYEGFKNDIKPKLIGGINNLEFIPWEENLKKGISCSITLEELRDITVRVKTAQ